MRTSTKLSGISLFFWFLMFVVIVVGPAFFGPNMVVIALGCVTLGLVSTVFLFLDLKALDEISDALVGIPSGDYEHPKVPEDGGGDLKRLAVATNSLKGQVEAAEQNIASLVSGKLGVAAAETKVLASGAISDADRAKQSAKGIEAASIDAANQMRRLAIQARLIAHDNLRHPVLDEKVPGEVGESFSLLVRRLRRFADRADDLAGGHLLEIDEDETGDIGGALNGIVERYRELSSEVVDTAVHISSSAEEILSVLREQEFAASHQASGVEETQRTMETLLSSAKRIAESAQTVFKSAEKTQANNRTVAERIGELKSHTERIGEILEGIKSIADRSDILALNASLEGMRAGEAGKGFALVAAEMRRLAENIKESVGDIKELLSDIRESALSSVMATEEGTSLSERTTESALKITLITQQQQSGTEQVTQSMEELSSLINHSVAGMRQVTTATSELVSVSDDLRDVVEEFRARPPAGASGEFRTRRLPAEVSKRMTTDEANRRRATKVAETRKTEAPGRPAPASEPDGAESDEELPIASRETVSVFAPVIGATNEDPPTVELTGMSEEDEREMLAEAMRTRARREGSEASEASAQEEPSEPSADEDLRETEPARKSSSGLLGSAADVGEDDSEE